MHIRKATLLDARGIAQVHVDSWITTYRNIIPERYLDRLTYDAREELWKRNLENGAAFVVEDESGKIIGFADGGNERTGKYETFEGELYSIYVLQENQAQGLGSLLLKAVANDLKSKNLNSLLIWVLKENHSCGFYEKMGGKAVDSKSIEIAGKRLIEVAYGWGDIRLIK